MRRREQGLSRRGFLAAGAALPFAIRIAGAAEEEEAPLKLKGRLQQSASKWCYGGVSFDDLCRAAKRFGLVGIDLLGPGEFKKVQEFGLACTMTSCNSIPKGFNRPEHHEDLIRNLRGAIEATAAAGFRNVVCFSGNRAGMPDDVGLKNCAEGLKKIVGYAEEKKIILCMEYLNSKQHTDYMCDSSAWAFELVKTVGSPHCKILYDLYHVAMMEATIVEKDDPATGKRVKVAEHDLIEKITKNVEAIGHFHTGGFPGRNDLDATQLLDWPALMRAIAEAGYKGYVAHEFVPKAKDPAGKLAALKQAVLLCDV
jgi:hydroxypyruvate isomerase